MHDSVLIKIILGVIGLILGTFFMFIYIWQRKRYSNFFSHDKKAETIMGHVKKYYLFMLAALFYIISATGFISLIYS